MKKEYDFSKARRGAVVPNTGKTRITIFVDDDTLLIFRKMSEKTGKGYQTLINEALRTHLAEADQPVTEKTLRLVLRQELPEYLAQVKMPARKPKASTARK